MLKLARRLTRPFCSSRSGSGSGGGLGELRALNAYEILGVQRDASASTIKERYHALARQHHPDAAEVAASAHGQQDFASISAAYHSLSDEARRAEVDAALDRDPLADATDLAVGIVAMGKAGRIHESMSILVTLLSGGTVISTEAEARPPLADAASTVLELAALHGAPHHDHASKLWQVLKDWDAVDARACDAFFRLSMRSGHAGVAMSAAREASERGLSQTPAMISALRQAKRYKEKRDGLQHRKAK